MPNKRSYGEHLVLQKYWNAPSLMMTPDKGIASSIITKSDVIENNRATKHLGESTTRTYEHF